MIKTYEPDNSLKKGSFLIFSEIYMEIKNNHWLISQLFMRDFKALYKQSFIGILWIFIIPFFSVGTFIVLNQAGIFDIGEVNAPYPIYAVFGIASWQLFSSGLMSSSNSLVNAGSMVTKINFSKKSLIIASMGRPIVSFLVQFGLLLTLFVVFGYKPSIAIFLTPLLLAPIMLFGLGFGFIFSILYGIMRDIGNVISLFLTFFMFLTPVLYAKPTDGILGTLTTYNPMYYLISIPRELILTGATHEWEGFMLSAILSLITFILCIFFFHISESKIAERI